MVGGVVMSATITVTVDREKLREALESPQSSGPADELPIICRWPRCNYEATWWPGKDAATVKKPHSGDCPLAEEE